MPERDATAMGIGAVGSTARRASSSRRRFGSTRRWRRLRSLVLMRDGHRCATCGGYGNDVDHVIPRALGGRDVPSNLRVRCAHCNRSEGGRLGAAMQQRREWPGAIELD